VDEVATYVKGILMEDYITNRLLFHYKSNQHRTAM